MNERVAVYLKKYSKQFKAAFGLSLGPFLDDIMLMIGIPSLDIIKLDDYMVKRGYDITKDGSLADYITSKYSPEAKILVDELIKA